jgi:hypothetical protein
VLNGIYQLLAHTDDFSPLSENINTIKKNADTLFMGGKEDGLELNTQKKQNTILSLYQRKMRKSQFTDC